MMIQTQSIVNGGKRNLSLVPNLALLPLIELVGDETDLLYSAYIV
jgi:hypothetical protein